METKSLPSASERRGAWQREALAVFHKDWTSELRARHALAAILLFAITSLLLMALLAPTAGFGLDATLKPAAEIRRILLDPAANTESILQLGQTELRAQLLAGLFWVIMFFSAMAGLPRVFVKEEESRTADLLRLSARPSAIFAGKLLFNAALMLLLAGVITPQFVVLFAVQIAQPGRFALEVLVGALSLAGASTLLGAMVARAGGRGYLMLVIGFVPLFPALAMAILGTADAIHGNPGNLLLPGVSYLVAAVSYLVAMVALSALLFEAIWND